MDTVRGSLEVPELLDSLVFGFFEDRIFMVRDFVFILVF